MVRPPAWHTKSANGGGAVAAGGATGSTLFHLQTKVGGGGAELAPAWLGVGVGVGIGVGVGFG